MYRDSLSSTENTGPAEIDDTRQLKILVSRLIENQEEERTWVSRQLHDVLGQSFTLLKLVLDALKRAPSQDASGIVDDAVSIVDEATDRVRAVSRRMRPGILDLSLRQALEWLFKHSGLEIRFHCVGLKDNLPSDFNTAVYRIVQEAVDNIARHAGVTSAVVDVSVKKGILILHVSDEGLGFDTAPLGSGGLLYMRQRAAMAGGSLDIASSPGKGTVVSAVLPLPASVKPRVIC